jgi:hypothetical protein
MSLTSGHPFAQAVGIGERANRRAGENRGGARLPNRRTGFTWRLIFLLANGVSTSSDVPSRHPTRATARRVFRPCTRWARIGYRPCGNEFVVWEPRPTKIDRKGPLLSGFAKPALHVNQPGVGEDLLRSLRLSGTNLHPKSNSVSIAVNENGETCSIKNLLFIRETNGRIEQTMKLENTDVSTKELVATRAKRR